MTISDEAYLSQLKNLSNDLDSAIVSATNLANINILGDDYYTKLLIASAKLDCCVGGEVIDLPIPELVCSAYTVEPVIESSDGKFYVAINGKPHIVVLYFYPYKTIIVTADELTFECTPTKTILKTSDPDGTHVHIMSMAEDPLIITPRYNSGEVVKKFSAFDSAVCIVSTTPE